MYDRLSCPLLRHPARHQAARSLSGAGRYQGKWTAERGLTFYTARLAGHELPGYTPGVAYRMLEILLGKVRENTRNCNSTDKLNRLRISAALNPLPLRVEILPAMVPSTSEVTSEEHDMELGLKWTTNILCILNSISRP